ncbi:MAG: hypothetical protein OXR66_09280 [Candidatus Woesearchaeota archaeon]|nr:hypothetical protein [Candidatus Woesearchaeota archaeon]
MRHRGLNIALLALTLLAPPVFGKEKISVHPYVGDFAGKPKVGIGIYSSIRRFARYLSGAGSNTPGCKPRKFRKILASMTPAEREVYEDNPYVVKELDIDGDGSIERVSISTMPALNACDRTRGFGVKKIVYTVTGEDIGTVRTFEEPFIIRDFTVVGRNITPSGDRSEVLHRQYAAQALPGAKLPSHPPGRESDVKTYELEPERIPHN